MKFKIFIIFLFLTFIALNIYSIKFRLDPYTQSKIQLSKLKGSTSYLGRLKLWQLLVQNNDWNNAATLELGLNPKQVKDYKLLYLPENIQNKLSLLTNQETKTANDYLELAQIQSVLGMSSQAIDSIKKAHQLDPIRSDIDRLFYQITQ